MNVSWITTASLVLLCTGAMTACSSDASKRGEDTKGIELEDSTTTFDPDAETPPTLAEIGAEAPNFSLRDLAGEKHKLSNHDGQIVVLEWYNPNCPFVVYAHGEDGPLHDLAQRWIDQGVVWYAINSGAPGKQGTGTELNLEKQAEYGFQHPVLIDETGEVGRRYQAKKTPHMFVIDAQGTLVYAGGLDNAPFGKVPDGSDPHSFVEEVLDDLVAGREPRVRTSKPYGCSVKYAK